MSTSTTWDNFVEALRPQWDSNAITKELLLIIQDEGLSIAVWACLRSQSVSWLDQKVPAIGNRKPRELLHSSEGKEELKWVLMSNPWW